MGSSLLEESHIAINPLSGKSSIYINDQFSPIERQFQVIPRSTIEGALLLVYTCGATAVITFLVMFFLATRNARYADRYTLAHALVILTTALYFVRTIGLDTIGGVYSDPGKLAWEIYQEHFDSICTICNQTYNFFTVMTSTKFRHWLSQFLTAVAFFNGVKILIRSLNKDSLKSTTKPLAWFSATLLSAVILHHPAHLRQSIVQSLFVVARATSSELFSVYRQIYEITMQSVQSAENILYDVSWSVVVILSVAIWSINRVTEQNNCSAASVLPRLHSDKLTLGSDEYQAYQDVLFGPILIHTSGSNSFPPLLSSAVPVESNNIGDKIGYSESSELNTESSKSIEEQKPVTNEIVKFSSPSAEKHAQISSEATISRAPTPVCDECHQLNVTDIAMRTQINADEIEDLLTKPALSSIEASTCQAPEQEEAKFVALPPALEIRQPAQQHVAEPGVLNTKPVVLPSTHPEPQHKSQHWAEDEEEDLEYFNILPTFSDSAKISILVPEFEVIEESMPNCRSSEISAVDTSNARKAIPAVPLESAQSQEDVDSNIPTPLTRLSANTPANVNSSDYSRSSGNQFSTRSQQTGESAGLSRGSSSSLWSGKTFGHESNGDEENWQAPSTRNPVVSVAQRPFCRDYVSGICKGQDGLCRLSHYNKNNSGPCRDYAYGTCIKDSDQCLYDHTDDERALEWARQTCDAFARGKCPYGGLCEKIHDREYRTEPFTSPCKTTAMTGQCRNGSTCIFSHDEDAIDWKRRQCIWFTKYECKYDQCFDMHEMMYHGRSSKIFQQHRRAHPTYTWVDNRWAVTHRQTAEREEFGQHHHETKPADNAHSIWVSKQLEQADRVLNNPSRPRRKLNVNSLASVQALMSQTGSGRSRPSRR